MRYLAIDLGDARTGLALGDDVTKLASPAGLVEVSIKVRGGEALLEALAREVDRLLSAGDAIVVGLPLHMDGTKGARARLVEAFGARLGERTGRIVHFQDERLTSVDAQWALDGSGLTHGQKKKRRDQIAAARILEEFLGRSDGATERRSNEGEEGEG